MIERRTFPNALSSIAGARVFVERRVGEDDSQLARKVRLLVSELATNVVRHTTSDFTVEVEWSGDELHVRVTDSGDGEPVVRSPGHAETSGRGLRLVQELADAFGIDRVSGAGTTAKTVWFLVRLYTGRPVHSDETSRELPSVDSAHFDTGESRGGVSGGRRQAGESRGLRERFQYRCTCRSFLPVNTMRRTLPPTKHPETRDCRPSGAGKNRCTAM